MKKENICWDTSIFLTHIRGATTEEQEREIQTVLRLVEQEKFQIIVSTILYAEVLESRMPKNAMGLFDALMKRIGMVRNVAVNLGIAKKAQKIRNRIHTLKTPDAIHIATAIVGEAIVFHTFDKDLIKLSDKDTVDNLKITPCHISGTTPSLL